MVALDRQFADFPSASPVSEIYAPVFAYLFAYCGGNERRFARSPTSPKGIRTLLLPLSKTPISQEDSV